MVSAMYILMLVFAVAAFIGGNTLATFQAIVALSGAVAFEQILSRHLNVQYSRVLLVGASIVAVCSFVVLSTVA